MKKKNGQRNALMVFSAQGNPYSTYISSHILEIPTQTDKKEILNFVEDPNFEEFYYFPIDVLRGEIDQKNLRLFGGSKKKYFRSRKNGDVREIIVDKEGRWIVGTFKQPYKLYDPPEKPDRWEFYERKGEVVPYVCYHANGELIKEALEYILSKLPENTSEESVVLVFQWKENDPTRTGYFVTPRRIKISSMSKMLSK